MNCPTCGQTVPTPASATEKQIVDALGSHDSAMVYAVGTPNGLADYSQWRVTKGALRGVAITRQVIIAMVAKGLLVPYLDGNDTAYVTPAGRKRVDLLMQDWRHRQMSRRRPCPSAQKA